MTTLMSLQNIHYYYQDGEYKRVVLQDIQAEFNSGIFYTILGPSGSGKTTLLSLLAGLDSPKGGTILYRGKNIQKSGLEKHRRNHVGIVFQSYNLIKYLTAVENVLEAMYITENTLPLDKKNVAYNLLDFLGITRGKANRLVTKLSGGEQQRVAIARALSTNVDIILADEPTGNLNEELEQGIVEVLQSLAHQYHKCIIVVTHSEVLAKASDICYKLAKGMLLPHMEASCNE